MAVAIEAFTVVVRNEAIIQRYPGGTEAFRANIPNQTFCADEFLTRCAFMVHIDAMTYLKDLGSLGLQVENGIDAVICDGFSQEIHPECDWLSMSTYKKAVFVWHRGEDVKTIIGPPGWSLDATRVNYASNEDAAKRLKFLRNEGNVQVFWDNVEGKEVYVGRTQAPLELLFKQASDIVVANLRIAGTPRAGAEASIELQRAVEMLEVVAEGAPDIWRVHWMLGKAWHALEKPELAHAELTRAFDLEKEEIAIPKELCGICLELGRGSEAVRIAEYAVGLNPRDPALVGNLSLAYLIDGKLKEAETTVRAALTQNPDDRINQNLQRVITQIAKGERTQPRNLFDLSRPKG